MRATSLARIVASSVVLAIALAGRVEAAGERDALRDRAEAALAGSSPDAAIDAFERVTATGHGTDGEMGLVRAYMQAGRYRQALAFGAHVAGEHFDDPGAGILYAWLLRVGGQVDVAARVFGAVAAQFPADPLVVATSRSFAAPVAIASGALLVAPHRMAPVLSALDGDEPSSRARVIAGATLIDGGTGALMARSADAAPATNRLWVRNGLGVTRRAKVDTARARPGDGSAVDVLTLLVPFADSAADRLAVRDPHAGSPAYAAEYALSPEATPAWPQLRQGFIGAFAKDRPPRLAIDLGGAPGAPVFDIGGDVVGMVVNDADGRPALLPVSMWPRPSPEAVAGPARPANSTASVAATRRAAEGIDRVYEHALRISLQVLVEP